jgi:hypothetical protein
MHLHGTGGREAAAGKKSVAWHWMTRTSLGEISTALQPSPSISSTSIEEIL